LVGSCGECGEVLRYQNHVGGQRLGHWLELWLVNDDLFPAVTTI